MTQLWWQSQFDKWVAECDKCDKRGGKVFLCSRHEGMEDGFYWLASHAPSEAVVIVAEEINKSIGPTGGWLCSPQVMRQVIIARLRASSGAAKNVIDWSKLKCYGCGKVPTRSHRSLCVPVCDDYPQCEAKEKYIGRNGAAFDMSQQIQPEPSDVIGQFAAQSTEITRFCHPEQRPSEAAAQPIEESDSMQTYRMIKEQHANRPEAKYSEIEHNDH